MDLRSLISKLESIESKIVNEQALTLQQVAAVEKAAADKATADKAKGGWAAFTTWDPKTAGDIALSKLADQHGLPGLFNSQGEYVVAASRRMDGETGEKPQIAPPTPDDWGPLQKLGLVPRSAEGPAGLTNLLTGGKAQQEFDRVKGDSARVAARNSSDAFIKERLAKLKELIAKLKATLSSSDFSLNDVRKESIARELVESFGYKFLLEEPMPDISAAAGPATSTGKTSLRKGPTGWYFELPSGQKVTQGRGFASAEAAMDWAKNNPHIFGNPPAGTSAVDDVAKAVGASDAEKEVAKVAAKGAGGKIVGRIVPYAGMALDAADAVSRWKEGDKVGAGIAGVGAGLGWIPGIGTGISLGTMAANQARDYKAGRGDLFGPDGAFPSQTKESATESIMSFRKKLELIEAKATIEKNLGDEYFFDNDLNLYTAEGVEVTDNLTKQVIWESVWDKEVHFDEGAYDWLLGKAVGAGRGIRDFFRGAASLRDPSKYRDAVRAGGAEKAGAAVARVAQKNPKTAAAASVAAGGTAGTMLGGDGKSTSAEPPTTSSSGSNSGQAAQPSSSSGDSSSGSTDSGGSSSGSASGSGKAGDSSQGSSGSSSSSAAGSSSASGGPTPEQADLIKQIEKLMSDLHDIEEPDVMSALQDARSAIDAVSKGSKKDSGGNASSGSAGDQADQVYQGADTKPTSSGSAGDQADQVYQGADTRKDTTPAPSADKNRDSMPFSRAFADARAEALKGGPKVFTWKGKKYSTAIKGEDPTLDAAISKPRTSGQGAQPSKVGDPNINVDPMGNPQPGNIGAVGA